MCPSVGMGVEDCAARSGMRRAEVLRLSDAVMHPDGEPRLSQGPRFGRFVGTSAPMARMYERLERVAPTEEPVLLVGESGTGKELAARSIHDLSRRRGQSFLAINAGAIPSNMMESEFFGHERGSFTGASQRHAGHLERARGGTLLLDEITEMPIELQSKLLRVLESRTLQRVGGESDVSFDVRIIAATNLPPEEAIALGRLRKDLYYRLAVFRVDLPALRERAGDIELIARHFLDELNREHGTRKRLPALSLAFDHPWPGNVRELRNVIHDAFIMADTDLVIRPPAQQEKKMTSYDTSAVAEATDTSSALLIRVGTTAAEAERRLILATLEACGGNKNRAAAILGVSLKTIYNRLNAYRTLGQSVDAAQPVATH